MFCVIEEFIDRNHLSRWWMVCWRRVDTVSFPSLTSKFIQSQTAVCVLCSHVKLFAEGELLTEKGWIWRYATWDWRLVTIHPSRKEVFSSRKILKLLSSLFFQKFLLQLTFLWPGETFVQRCVLNNFVQKKKRIPFAIYQKKKKREIQYQMDIK